MKKCLLLFLICVVSFAVSCANTDPTGSGSSGGGGGGDTFYDEVVTYLAKGGDPDKIYTKELYMVEYGTEEPVGYYDYPWLVWASCYNHIEAAKLLINAGADLYSCTMDDRLDLDRYWLSGFTSMNLASAAGHVEIMKLLIAKDKDVIDFKYKISSRTALVSAAICNQVEVAKLLLEEGAEVNLLCSMNKTAWDYADSGSYGDYTEMKALLESYGGKSASEL